MSDAAKLNWQPIATAPRDDRQLLVVMRDGRLSTASYTKLSDPQAVWWVDAKDVLATLESR